ncbi:EamA-like transporter family protein [uncultured archaeon]|nr:EamA-like transporter family protein [uncultured archaeon]
MLLEGSILAAVGSMLFWGFGDFFIQRETRRVGNLESLAFISIIGSLGLFPFVIPELPLLFTLQNVLLLFFISMVGFVVAMLDFEALREGKLSVVEVILEIELPITAMLGYLFFGETLSFIQLATVFLIFAGIIMISVESFSGDRRSKKRLEKGVLLAVFTAVGMGLANFLTAFGSKQVSPLMVTWMPWLVISIISLFFVHRREGFGSMLKNASRFRRLILVTGVFDTLGWLLYAVALVNNELAITTAITESYPAIGVLLGVWLNKEEILPHQYAGAALALAASVALALIV